MSRKAKAVLIFIVALIAAIGLSLVDLDNAKDGVYEAYRGQRSAWN